MIKTNENLKFKDNSKNRHIFEKVKYHQKQIE